MGKSVRANKRESIIYDELGKGSYKIIKHPQLGNIAIPDNAKIARRMAKEYGYP